MGAFFIVEPKTIPQGNPAFLSYETQPIEETGMKYSKNGVVLSAKHHRA